MVNCLSLNVFLKLRKNMPNFQLTEKDFAGINCNDLSIQELPFGKILLILLCQNIENSAKLLEILHTNPFKLNVLIDDKTGNYKLDFKFIDSEIGFVFDTNKSEQSYPAIKKIIDNKMNFLSTGVLDQKTGKGKNFSYSINFVKIGNVNISDCFKYASEVQFINGEIGVQPSAVVLIFDDYDHIYATESNDAFNLLLSMSKNQLHMEFGPSDDKVSLRIWDIIIDLDIKIENLKYSKEQFEAFRENTDQSESFAFVLGFKPIDDELIRAASTKQNKLDIITIHGYEISDDAN